VKEAGNGYKLQNSRTLKIYWGLQSSLDALLFNSLFAVSKACNKAETKGFFLIISSFGSSNTTVMERKAARLLAEAGLLQPVSKGYGVTAGTGWEMTLKPLWRHSLQWERRLR